MKKLIQTNFSKGWAVSSDSTHVLEYDFIAVFQDDNQCLNNTDSEYGLYLIPGLYTSGDNGCILFEGYNLYGIDFNISSLCTYVRGEFEFNFKKDLISAFNTIQRMLDFYGKNDIDMKDIKAKYLEDYPCTVAEINYLKNTDNLNQ